MTRKSPGIPTGFLILIPALLLVTLAGGCSGGERKDDMSELAKMDTPVFWAEGHPGKLDRESWKVEVAGLVEKPTVYSWEDLMNFPKTVADARLTSVTRWSVGGDWGGIPVSDILEDVGIGEDAKFMRVWSYRNIYDTSIPLEIAMKERTLLAYEFEGDPLTEDYGGPIRLFVPYLWGYKSAKSIVKIELMDHYVPGYWEKRGYSDDGEIQPGKVIDVNTGKTRRIPGGEVRKFLDE